MNFVNNNGEIIPNEGFTMASANRGHLYGDGLFESIRIVDGKVVNIDVHVYRLLEGMSVLKMRVPNYFTPEFFLHRINELIQKSNISAGGRVRISVDRASGGTYRPLTNEVTFFIEVYPLDKNEFVLNSKGLEIDLYTTVKKHNNILANFKTKNALVYVLGAIEAKEKGLDDLLITNQDGNVIESTNSNMFIVSNEILYTPSLNDGCLGGTMRMRIINLAIANNIKVYESSITPQNLLVADEIFLTNAINGVVWVSGYRTKRYMNSTAKKFITLLNDTL